MGNVWLHRSRYGKLVEKRWCYCIKHVSMVCRKFVGPFYSDCDFMRCMPCRCLLHTRRMSERMHACMHAFVCVCVCFMCKATSQCATFPMQWFCTKWMNNVEIKVLKLYSLHYTIERRTHTRWVKMTRTQMCMFKFNISSSNSTSFWFLIHTHTHTERWIYWHFP